MRAYFLILPYLTLAIAQTCDRLRPLYTSFECRPGCINRIRDTKYDCRQSPYLTQFVDDRCYFNGSYYDNDVTLPMQYPGFPDSEVCSYTCDTITNPVGPFFDPDDCEDVPTIDPAYADLCIHDVLYNTLYFNAHRAVVYPVGGRRCPIEWINDVPSGLVSDASCTANQENCCQYGDIFLSVDTEFELNGINCKCACPPIVECLR